MPEFVDPVFEKTSPKLAFSMTDNERFGLVLAKTGSINSSTESLLFSHLFANVPESRLRIDRLYSDVNSTKFYNIFDR